jgi:hypothetical protein
MIVFSRIDGRLAASCPVRAYSETPRSGLRSINGVPSRQSRPRTCNVVPSIATRSTTEDAMGFGRTGERNAKLPVVCPVGNGVCNTRSRRARVHPVEDLDTAVIGQIGERRAPALIDRD